MLGCVAAVQLRIRKVNIDCVKEKKEYNELSFDQFIND